ncbi:MAG TPA: putative peptide maturation dehydrogenase [Dokdonella sp.]|nr:putative peptide maturation dehydrogenase [Dokdonella sp.]
MKPQDVRVRLCAGLYLERREILQFDPVRLLQGETGLVATSEMVALVPYLAIEVPLTASEVAALDVLPQELWQSREAIADRIGADRLQSLMDKGVIVLEGTSAAARDDVVRESNWHPRALLTYIFGRWSSTDSVASQYESQLCSIEDMIAACGLPPPHFHARPDAVERTLLPRPTPDDLDVLFNRRVTCRNFDKVASLSQAQLGAVLHRSFGVQGHSDFAQGAVALKKNHPSGGGLHPLEAYVLVQRVGGLSAGLYHYNAETHALDLLQELSPSRANALALVAVAGQHYFAAAPVLLVIAARFARSFWKYRHHLKIYRAILLEAGHVSQNIYLAATDLDLGAYITAAINEVQLEEAFGLDPLEEGLLAVCGFGPRATSRETVELDPGLHVWDTDARLISRSSCK